MEAIASAVASIVGVGGAVFLAWKIWGIANEYISCARERDSAVLERQSAEAQLQQVSRELARDRAAHERQLARAREEITHVRDQLREAGITDPSVTDERLLRIEERLAARSDPRGDNSARMFGDPTPEPEVP